MCESNNSNDITSTSCATNYFSFYNGLHKNLCDLETELFLAQNDFKNCVLECLNSINVHRLKLNDHTGNKLKSHNDEEEIQDSNIYNSQKIEQLQNDLKESLSKKKSSIKRALMKLSNLQAQYDLLNLPYYELKCYYKQIIDKKTMIGENSGNKSYAEALEDLEQILVDEDNVENKTTCLVKECNSDKPELGDSYSFLNDEYKNIPHSTYISQCESVADEVLVTTSSKSKC